MTVYEASPTNRRSTKTAMEELYSGLLAICSTMQPMTVRQIYYQATVQGLVEKTEAGYVRVQRALVHLRRTGRLPFSYIADNVRWQRKPETWRDPQDAMRATARFYRKALWDDADVYVEVWLEKDALSAVVYDVTDVYDVPLMVTRGYASLTFLHVAAETMRAIGKPTFIYHLGDYDPSGVNAAEKVESSLREYAHGLPITFERLAERPEQITAWNLPTRPTKTTDTRAKNFGEVSVELDAIDGPRLRKLVRDALDKHMPAEQLEVLKAAEQSEREWLESWASVGNAA
ncbi:hypothetical protein DK847_14640 [Aestuariivirga litoralis]|uniref:DUF2399 domain-containing protein n=1 Tax=Aestuariivirga litoralis TaxID=2650924 RepID=A0A2W2BJN9_9HYPH|nr:hypothetical protein [Aestuariivirga litoralis]PZF76409.1 hypothetical protein DK847_14640 [Aestuariivirga litoralis]